MQTTYPDTHGVLPDTITAYMRRAVRISVADLDALASVEARRRGPDGWTDWRPVIDLLDGDGTVWCGDGAVLQVRAANHTALTLEDELAPAELPRIATVASALEWLGLPTSGNRPDLNARLEEAP